MLNFFFLEQLYKKNSMSYVIPHFVCRPNMYIAR
jgi:hypothetical protein